MSEETEWTQGIASQRKKRRRQNKKVQDEYVGQRVARKFNDAYYCGLIVSFKAAENETEKDLWHVRHDDGDEEDLERHEVESGIRDWKKTNSNKNMSIVKAKKKKHDQSDLIYPSRVRVCLGGLSKGSKTFRLNRGIVRFKKSMVAVDDEDSIQVDQVVEDDENDDMDVNEDNVDDWENDDECMLAEDIHGLLSFAEVRTDRQTNAAIAALGSSVLPTLVRCRQSCVYPKLMKRAIAKLEKVGLIDADEYDLDSATNASSKLDAVCSKIIERKDNQRSKLIFCHYRGEIDKISRTLQDAGMKVAVFDGRTNYAQRQEILEDHSLDALILQIMTGSEGLNLQHFKEIYFVSPHWNPAVEDQAVARCHRIGQKDKVDIFRFTMAGFDDNGMTRTLDKYASEVQDSKRSMYNIVDDSNEKTSDAVPE